MNKWILLPVLLLALVPVYFMTQSSVGPGSSPGITSARHPVAADVPPVRNDEAAEPVAGQEAPLHSPACEQLADPEYLAGLVARYGIHSYARFCAAIARSRPEIEALVTAEAGRTAGLDRFFIPESRHSDYRTYDDAVLRRLADSDAVAAQTLAHRVRYIDPPAARRWYVRAAVLSGKPGPLVDSLSYREAIRWTIDPQTGARAYESVDGIVDAAVFASVAMRMGYPEDLKSAYLDHLRHADGDELLTEVDARADALHAAITQQERSGLAGERP